MQRTIAEECQLIDNLIEMGIYESNVDVPGEVAFSDLFCAFVSRYVTKNFKENDEIDVPAFRAIMCAFNPQADVLTDIGIAVSMTLYLQELN
jgi:hypothetical protein